MKAIRDTFKRRPAFVAYITAGQRGLNFTKQAAIALAHGGVDILEIGVPFSDPVADGPVIARAMDDALALKVNLSAILDTINDIKNTVNIPIVLFTYFNPLFQVGLDKIMTDAVRAGIDAVLTVDIALEESQNYFTSCKKANIGVVSVISPTTTPERILKICDHYPAFLYYACRNGITGIKDNLPEDFRQKIMQIKSLSDIPVIAGFGISNKKIACAALDCADGFVVGSLFVKAISEGITLTALQQLASELDPRERVIS